MKRSIAALSRLQPRRYGSGNSLVDVSPFNDHSVLFSRRPGKPTGMSDHDDLFAAQMLALGFTPPELPSDPPTSAAVEAADRRSRQWTSSHTGVLRPGSEAHKQEVCRMFRETFNPYRPSIISWPTLSPEMLQRLTSLPIWDIAVHTESRARLRFAAYAGSVADNEVRAAVLLNAWEESRHKEVLAHLVATYGIPLASEPPFNPPRDSEWAYLLTGYCECIDSFFAFGLFELARRSGFFPPELVATFEPVIQEECRHILLFANWLAWHRANLPWWRRPYFELRVAAVWVVIAWERIVLARSMEARGSRAREDSNFTVNNAQAVSPVEIHVSDLMALCLKENDRRFAGYDPRLMRPTTVPGLARFALLVTRPWARKMTSPRYNAGTGHETRKIHE
jgi:hypothetical protein